MEISPAVLSMSKPIDSPFPQFRLQSQLPFFSPFSLSSKSSCPLRSSPSSSPYLRKASAPLQKWLHQPTTIRALSDEATSTVDLGMKPTNVDPGLAVKKKAAEVHGDLKGTSIFLVGVNNAMKTSVGKLIADVLRYYYFDSDSIVEEAAGEDSSGKSFRERDEEGFRESETEVLKQLSSMGRLVVNAGNGAVQGATNLALLRHGISVWLDVPLDMIAKGVIADDGQSSADSVSEALSQLSKLYEDHKAGYATADATVSLQKLATKFGFDELEQVTIEDMVLEILKEIEKLTKSEKDDGRSWKAILSTDIFCN